MKLKTKDGAWNPYLVGVLIGILAIVSAYATTQVIGKTNYLGASTTFVRAAAFLEQTVAADYVSANEYFTKTKIRVDWQFMLLIGVFLGSLLSSLIGKSFKMEKVPPLWKEYFGASSGKRAIVAFLGGIVAMIGARMADGCPNGHGLSGIMQLSMSSFVAMIMFFGVAVIVARLIYVRR